MVSLYYTSIFNVEMTSFIFRVLCVCGGFFFIKSEAFRKNSKENELRDVLR